MPQHKKKQALQLQKLYQHFAEHGFKQVGNVSHLTKAIGISRSLFYFYFEDTEDLLFQLSEYHKALLHEQHAYILSQGITHTQYLQRLVEHKDLYFFSIQCRRYAQEHPKIAEMFQMVLDTVDYENFQLFVQHYQLEGFSERAIKMLYSTFRGFWYDNSHYGSWDEARALDLAQQVNEMMILLRSRHQPEG